MCVPFMDPNASRMAAMGISFAAVCSGCDLSNDTLQLMLMNGVMFLQI